MSGSADLEFSADRRSLLVAALAIGLCVLSSGWLVSLGCQPVAREPTTTFTVQPADGTNGVTVIHAGGDGFAASDIYVRTRGMNASFAALSPAYEPDSTIEPDDEITLTGLSEDAHVDIVWFDPTVKYAGNECMDATPYTRSFASFTVGNSSTYSSPPAKGDHD